MFKNIQLSQALNTKLCHDLAANIGAIDNSLSLIDHTNGNISSKAKSLALAETKDLVTKIKFLRVVYGSNDDVTTISLIRMSKILIDFFQGARILLNLHFEEGLIMIDAQLAKATISLVTLASENIGLNGRIDVYLAKNKNLSVTLLARGNHLISKDECLATLSGNGEAPITVNNCREYYVNSIYTESGYRVLAQKKQNSIEYKVIKI